MGNQNPEQDLKLQFVQSLPNIAGEMPVLLVLIREALQSGIANRDRVHCMYKVMHWDYSSVK